MKILVFGGDKRQIYAAEYLSQVGHEVILTGFDADGIATEIEIDNSLTKKNFEAIVFGIPSFDGKGKINCPLSSRNYFLADVIEPCGDAKIFCAMASNFEKAFMREYKAAFTDYFACERLCMPNSLLTAEGALRVFLDNSEITVFNSNLCVTGYGRIGKLLSEKLKALGANVTVYARSEKSLAEAECMGFRAISLDKFISFSNFDCVFNTVPSVLFDKRFAKDVTKTKYIELASSPGGLDEDAKKLFGQNYVPAPSLPGRYIPKSAGRIIGKCIDELLQSEFTNRR